jgi:UDP-4-amino-4,6-dideoxy-N-acetyl-beta-L-altrosamine N-acetyltransferase
MKKSTITLRPFGNEHKESTLVWFNDPDLARFMGRTRAITETEHNAWFERLKEREDVRYYAIETVSGGQHIGNVWLWDIDRQHRKAEVSILIGDKDTHNAGVGSEALDLCCQLAFEKHDLHKVYAHVLAFNPRAKRAFEKAGFQLEGTLREDRWLDGSFIDVYRLGRLETDSFDRPGE